MIRRNCQNRARTARPNLSLEQLESRQLMAADLTNMAAPPIVDPVDTDTTAHPPMLAAKFTPTANASGPRHRPERAPSRTVAVRNFDGTGNNIANPEWGSAGEQLLRMVADDYAVGASAAAGEDRPSAREISNALAAHSDEDTPNDRQMTAFIYVWGQFLDHDIDLTLPPESDGEAFDIAVPTGDEFFDPDGSGGEVIHLTRSRFDQTTGTDADNPREQINQITAWIDASVVYGSDQATADSLRTFVGGRMQTSEGDLLPADDEGYFMAGDVRANENVELSSMQTLFVREHNYWADRIAQENPRLTDEQIFQRARAIVAAEMQVITYKEFLPALLGHGALSRYTGYDPNVDPSIANEFSTAAFRFHTLINDDVEFFGDDGRAVEEEVELAEAFNNPDLLRESGIDSILKYAASTLSEEVDTQLVDSLRNFLFGQPGAGGFDLASLNIQRGRDHGLADYNSVREEYGLARVASFADITSNVEVQQKLEELYGTVDNIDLWVGGLAEDHVAGGSVGETFRTIVIDQFERLRDGDRFWYQRTFSGRELDRLERTTLASIIQRNTTTQNLQANVFFFRAEITGQVFADNNGDGRTNRRERGIAGVTVELLNDEGDVVATTTTDRNGRYRFTEFRETGDYQVRIVLPDRFAATTQTTRDVLISRGDMAIADLSFGLRMSRLAASANAVDDALTLHNNWRHFA
jgi:peroxidase